MTEPRLSYERARDIAAHAEPADREVLALRTDVPPEVLYFLASDDDIAVRRAVAANCATPALGNLVLAGDANAEIRRTLAEKISGIGRYHGIGEQQRRARAIADLTVEKLAGDRESDIRIVMSEILKDDPDATPSVIRALAFDEEADAALPVLEYSPLLTPEDLLELIAKVNATSPSDGRLSAIARRPVLDDRLAEALVASHAVPAITHLLGKANAGVQEKTLDTLVDHAAAEPGWEEPPAFRRDIGEETVQDLVERVTDQIGALFPAEQELPAGTRSTVQAMVRKRLEKRPDRIRGVAAAGFASADQGGFAPALEKAEALEANGQLDEATLRVLLLTDNDEELIAALSVLSDLTMRTVLHIVAAQSARAMCALAWKAGLSAEFAQELQLRLASVAIDAAIAPAPGGGYLLDAEEMLWQLSMFDPASLPI
jgi:uncharacterized protein (DUF2336 family)